MKSILALAALAAIGSAYAVPTATDTSTAALSCPSARTRFKYFGVNESGAEFGETKVPGVLGTDYTWPAPR